MQELWEEVKKKIAQRIPKNSYSLWIKPIHFLRKTGNTIYLGCPNKFSCKWVSENFLDLIRECFFDISEHKFDFEFKVIPKHRDTKSKILYSPDQMYISDNFVVRGPKRLHLNQNFVFEKFVVGPCNEFAYNASTTFAQSEEWNYGTLLMLASPGLGKTHLSQAVGHWILNKKPDTKVVYVTAEDFMNELIHAIKTKQIDSFKERYRKSCDVLLLEEIHFLSGKEKTQIELVHTLDSLINAKKKVIFTSCLPPNKIPNLSKQLSSRLSSGLITPINFPDYETRFKIISQKAKENRLNLSDEIIDFLASKITKDVRQMESVIKCLKAKAELMKAKIDLDLAEEIVSHFISPEPTISLEDIMNLVCKYYKIDPDSLRSKSRKRLYSNARNIYVYMARKYTDKPISEIAKSINRTHSTAIHAFEKIKDLLEKDANIRKQIAFLNHKINEMNHSVFTDEASE
ncbi:MAG: chromosomal replication initiator protein DnaA [Deltaproteobacteria bacterium]|nr:MAG: chromosomal replication initiator protein DnaA [Deltaproteobacteria bacterium]